METSFLTGYNAKNVLIEAAKILYKDYLNYEEKKESQRKIKIIKNFERKNL